MKTFSMFYPGQPRGKGRHRTVPLMRAGKPVLGPGGRPIMTQYTDEKTATYEGGIKTLAMAMMEGAAPFGGPLALTLDIVLEIPRSWSKRRQAAALAGQICATRKPDADNVEKAVSDALNGVVWVDDCQVVRTTRQKRFGGIPGVMVAVTELDGELA